MYLQRGSRVDARAFQGKDYAVMLAVAAPIEWMVEKRSCRACCRVCCTALKQQLHDCLKGRACFSATSNIFGFDVTLFRSAACQEIREPERLWLQQALKPALRNGIPLLFCAELFPLCAASRAARYSRVLFRRCRESTLEKKPHVPSLHPSVPNQQDSSSSRSMFA